MKYSLVEVEGAKVITVFENGELLTATDSHPNFQTIVEKVRAGNESVANLFDIGKAAAQKFERLGDRVTVANGHIYFDGDEVDNALTQQVARCIAEGTEDFKPLVKFFEKVMNNPQEHSREQLYRWLKTHHFTITSEGNILGYKGVRVLDNGDYGSIHAGPAVVDGEAVNGYVPNKVGSVVEMARGKVTFDPGVGCSSGLHVGTWDYANGFAQGAVLTVEVDPRDVVSVPTDCADAKMRVCRYTVKAVTDRPHTVAVYDYDDDENPCDEYGCEYDEYGECAVCGDYNEDYDEYTTPAVTDVTKAERWDTRQNHTKQKRDANGRFVKQV